MNKVKEIASNLAKEYLSLNKDSNYFKYLDYCELNYLPKIDEKTFIEYLNNNNNGKNSL